MSDTILTLLGRGFTIYEIAEALNAADNTVSVSTLKGYIAKIKADSKNTQDKNTTVAEADTVCHQ